MISNKMSRPVAALTVINVRNNIEHKHKTLDDIKNINRRHIKNEPIQRLIGNENKLNKCTSKSRSHFIDISVKTIISIQIKNSWSMITPSNFFHKLHHLALYHQVLITIYFTY